VTRALVSLAGAAGAAAADVGSRDVDDVISDVISLGEDASRHEPGDSTSSDDVTAGYPAEVIVEGQQMNKVGLPLWN